MARGPVVRGGEGPPSSAHAGVATPARPPAGSWAAAVPPACAGGWWARTHPEQAERVRVAFIWLLAGNQKLWTFLARMKDGKGRWRALEVTASNHVDALRRPISVSGQAISVGCSIGISFEGRGGPPTFSEEGRHGLYRAKGSASDQWAFYTLLGQDRDRSLRPPPRTNATPL